MKVTIDDTWKFVSTSEQDYRLNGYYDFYTKIEILLTESQYNLFKSNDTKRIFNVSKKKFNRFLETLK